MMDRLLRLAPGAAVVTAIAAAATVAGDRVPVIGAPVVAIVAGIGVAVVRAPSSRLHPGVAFSARQVLQASVVVLGTGLSLRQVVVTGISSMPVLVGTLAAALGAAWVVGRVLRMPSDLTTLIGVGTAICGASAIAATDAVIDADEADVSYAITTIFTFNVVAVLTYPMLGHLLGLSARHFGLWAGTAINDTSSVVAASTVYGHGATGFAVVVKLTRTLAIVPITLALASWRTRRRSKAAATGDIVESLIVEDPPADAGSSEQDAQTRATPIVRTGDPRGREVSTRKALATRRAFPLFIGWFVVAVAANTAGAVPSAWHRGLSDIATWMITAALAAIGLSTSVDHIRRAGGRPLLLGAILWATVCLASLGLQAATGTL
ncbi:MAG: YeiH family protein [Acidimicrobiales bacterium]